jgi:hypothetical protein
LQGVDQESCEGIPIFGVAFFDALEEDFDSFLVVAIGEGLVRFKEKAGALFGGELEGGGVFTEIPG